MKNIVVLVLVCLFASRSYSQGPGCAWVRSNEGPSLGGDIAKAICTDPSGNVYVTGGFKSASIQFGTVTLNNADNSGATSDFFIVKYDPSGNVVWAKRAGAVSNVGEDEGVGISSDASGNVYVTGTFFGGFNIFGSGLSGCNSYAVFVTKYDPLGNVLWSLAPCAPGGVIEYPSISEVVGNSFFACGRFSASSLTFGGTTLSGFNSQQHSYIAKIDLSGSVTWLKTSTPLSAGSDAGVDAAADADGGARLAGEFGVGAPVTFGNITLANSGVSSREVFVVKFDASGVPLWAKTAGAAKFSDNSGGNTSMHSIDVDASGNSIISGYFDGASLKFGSVTHTGNGSYLAKYDASGNILWSKHAPASYANYMFGSRVETDAAGNIYLTGSFKGNTISFGTTTLTNQNGGFLDMMLFKFDSNGNEIWARRLGNTVDEHINGLAVDQTGCVYIAGDFTSSSVNFDSHTINNISSIDAFAAKFCSNVPVNIVQGPQNQQWLVYPNPASGVFSIHTENQNDSFEIEVYSSVGTKILHSFAIRQVDLSKFEDGVYLLVFKRGGTVTSARIIKD